MEEHVDDDHDRVNIIRSKELAETGADTVAVARALGLALHLP